MVLMGFGRKVKYRRPHKLVVENQTKMLTWHPLHFLKRIKIPNLKISKPKKILPIYPNPKKTSSKRNKQKKLKRKKERQRELETYEKKEHI